MAVEEITKQPLVNLGNIRQRHPHHNIVLSKGL